MKYVLIKLFLLLIVLDLAAQPKNDLEKAYKKNSAYLLRKFIQNNSGDYSNYCNDTCDDISRIVRIVSDNYIRILEKKEKDESKLFWKQGYERQVPAQRYLIYNSDINAAFYKPDLFKWNVTVTEFNRLKKKRVYRDSAFTAVNHEKFLSSYNQPISIHFKKPVVHPDSEYKPVLITSGGADVMNDFLKFGKFEKKVKFLETTIQDVAGVEFSNGQKRYRFWGFSLFFENIMFNQDRSQALMTVIYGSSASEYYFQKRSNNWFFVSTGRRWTITS